MGEERSVWNRFFEQEAHRWREPHEAVVRLVPHLRERGLRRVLDLGCGAGRHLVTLARQGFEPYGLDISETALTHAREWLTSENHPAQLAKSDMAQLPYRDRSFEALISLYVIYHGTRAHIERVIAEIHRVLRPGGLCLLNFIGREHDRYGRGREIEPHTYVPDVGPDRGVTHHFSDREEVEELLRAFRVTELADVERFIEGEEHHHWQVVAEKGG